MNTLEAPDLSVVVIAFNMARELPRTLWTLSPAMQQGIEAGKYEVIVIDNGSTPPVDLSLSKRFFPNLRLHRMDSPSVSPCAAVNKGIELAKGRLIGVMIDGARMASPGLLAAALEASGIRKRTAVGTLAFHLGPKVQMESVREGYNKEVEDRLLTESNWEEDGYSLFNISVFAGSSNRGWFFNPAETNALFMSSDQWAELGGYDERFTSPGGGLANLDVWRRACDDPANHVVLLLGEATFHQVHGGIATNSMDSAKNIEEFFAEYKEIRGYEYARSNRVPFHYGSLHASVHKSLIGSLRGLPI